MMLGTEIIMNFQWCEWKGLTDLQKHKDPTEEEGQSLGTFLDEDTRTQTTDRAERELIEAH